MAHVRGFKRLLGTYIVQGIAERKGQSTSEFVAINVPHFKAKG